MSSLKIKNEDGTWQNIPLMGSYEAVEQAEEAKNIAVDAKNAILGVVAQYQQIADAVANIDQKVASATTSASTAQTSAASAVQALRDATLINNSGNADLLSTQNAADIIMLNDDIAKFDEGIAHINVPFANGSLNASTGEFNAGVSYRISSTALKSFDKPTTLYIASGFRIICLYWENETTFAHDGTGWVTSSVVIPANKLFKIMIARQTEIGTEVADIGLFTRKVTFETQTQKAIKEIQGKIENIPTYTEYDIYADGSGDFYTLRACLDSIKDSSPSHQYIINIHEGTYQIALWFTNEEITNGYGLFVPDYVTLRGVGDKHNVILTSTLVTQSNKWCPLNFKNVCNIENLTVYSKNCRYTIHDDWQVRGDYTNIRHIKNCIFTGDNTAYGVVYGSAVKGGANWEFENCVFNGQKADADGTSGACFLSHNNVDINVPSFIKFTNCRFNTVSKSGNKYHRGVCLASMTNNSTNGTVTVTFNGCDINGISLYENSATSYGAGINYWVNGFANKNVDVLIVNTDGKDYSGNVDLI